MAPDAEARHPGAHRGGLPVRRLRDGAGPGSAGLDDRKRAAAGAAPLAPTTGSPSTGDARGRMASVAATRLPRVLTAGADAEWVLDLYADGAPEAGPPRVVSGTAPTQGQRWRTSSAGGPVKPLPIPSVWAKFIPKNQGPSDPRFTALRAASSRAAVPALALDVRHHQAAQVGARR